MPELNFTPEQRAAIDTRGSTVLVSAAAGSGKTRVLTERLMAYLTDAEAPADIDRFLVITYTRAAAAELRSRILDGIYARIASDPENRRLRRQVALCARAEIGTIHSFCADFLRANCAALALAPDFQVADTERCALTRRKRPSRRCKSRSMSPPRRRCRTCTRPPRPCRRCWR